LMVGLYMDEPRDILRHLEWQILLLMIAVCKRVAPTAIPLLPQWGRLYQLGPKHTLILHLNVGAVFHSVGGVELSVPLGEGRLPLHHVGLHPRAVPIFLF
jgi:hypothetical protein